MKKYFVLALSGLAAICCLQGQTIEKPASKGYKTTFAIVVDEETYQQAQDELLQYKTSLESQGLGTYLVRHQWQRPEEIRDILHQLYREKIRLEGAVLVGDIPVPMIRDAQHLTSTFKMDQRIDWRRSSVPSDRFYDDFDLKFSFLKQDSLHQQYFYYSLDAASPQYIHMDIYTARIKPPLEGGSDFYGSIRQYLRKVVAHAGGKNVLRELMVYTGHGYHSESLNAWAGEQIALREQLPDLFRPGGYAKFLQFSMDTHMKFRILSEIQREDLDLAIFHTHGSDDAQLINGYPKASNPQPSIENVRRYLRSKVQAAADKNQDVAAVKARFHESMGVPYAWMDDALLDSVRQADSLFNANTDISIADVEAITPNARFVILDACDNGQFHLDDYIAAHYPFGNGKTILSMANSVGVLQDQWPDELIGILPFGVRAGNWLKEIAYLETHLFGDPSFAFEGSHTAGLNQAIVYYKEHTALWEKLLRDDPNPDIRAMALINLFRLKGEAVSLQLKNSYFSSPHATVRLEALKLLNRIGNADYLEVLKAAIRDPYELTRRLAVYMMGETGRDDMIPYLVRASFEERHSERVLSRVKNVLAFMDSEKVIHELEKQAAENNHLTDGAELAAQLIRSQQQTGRKLDKEYRQGDQLTAKEQLFSLRTLRAYRYHQAVPFVIRLVENEQTATANRVVALEALSWYGQSFQKPMILALCEKLIQSGPEELRDQAHRTKAILETKG